MSIATIVNNNVLDFYVDFFWDNNNDHYVCQVYRENIAVEHELNGYYTTQAQFLGKTLILYTPSFNNKLIKTGENYSAWKQHTDDDKVFAYCAGHGKGKVYTEPEQFGDLQRLYTDGYDLYVFLPNEPVEVFDVWCLGSPQQYTIGGDFCNIKTRYYHTDLNAIDSHDYCYYCGTDNGLHGEFRNGHDCYYCGSN